MTGGIARAAIIAGLSLAAVAAGAADDPARDSAEQLEKLRARIEAVQQNLEQDRSQQDELRLQLEDSERRFMALTRELAGLRKQISEQSALRRRTELQRREAESALRRNRAVLARQVRAAYVIGQRGQAKLVLNQDRGQRLTRVMTYYDYLNRARVERIGKILELARKLDELARKVKAQGAALEATRGRHQGTLTALEAVRDERQEMVRMLRQRIVGEEDELRHLKADERELSERYDVEQSRLDRRVPVLRHGQARGGRGHVCLRMEHRRCRSRIMSTQGMGKTSDGRWMSSARCARRAV